MPNLLADVRQDVNKVRVILDGVDVGIFPASGGNFSYDVSGVSNGSHTVVLTSIVDDPVWGSQESAHSAPLTFVRPAPPDVPVSLRLAP